jgi:hypothetical protein
MKEAILAERTRGDQKKTVREEVKIELAGVISAA